MMRYSFILVAFLLFSCGEDKEILLPKSNMTIVKDVADISPIYILFQKQDNDTLVEVDKQTIISTTNWVFNIDKRLPLKKILPEVIKLQNRKGDHQGKEKVDNFYSYADSIGKNMAFLPFTHVVYSLESQKDFAGNGEVSLVLKFDKHNKLSCNGTDIALNQLHNTIEKLYQNKIVVAFLHFDKGLSYDHYITDKIALSNLRLNNVRISNKEYIY